MSKANSDYSGKFKTELKKRTFDIETGKVKGSTWEEVKQKARKALKYKRHINH